MIFTFQNGFFNNTRPRKLSLLEKAKLKDRIRSLQDVIVVENVEIIDHDWNEEKVKISGNQV